MNRSDRDELTAPEPAEPWSEPKEYHAHDPERYERAAYYQDDVPEEPEEHVPHTIYCPGCERKGMCWTPTACERSCDDCG